MIVWSYGGGTQSVAIGVLIAQGKLPRPDRIVIADTGREISATWEYMDTYVSPLLAPLGLTIEVASHDLATVDLYDLQDKGVLIPAYTRGKGRLPTFCSSEWKTAVVQRYLRQTGVDKCDMWIGMSADEVERLKPSRRKWITHKWPLCFDVKPAMTRVDCIQLVTNFGLPRPPKSACWMCPHRPDAGWRDMQENAPGDFKKAVDFDNENRNANGGIWLHESRKPLGEVDFTQSDQVTLFDEVDSQGKCESGVCWT